MEEVSGEFIWAQKYCPQKIDDCILPEQTKKQIKEFVNSGEIDRKSVV